ncbi:MAG TPA: adenylate/guanylate cyclase domain-containing protein [Candidatus Dormibacteraeota bacterium]
MASAIRVFLADDSLIVREGVRALLGLAEDIEVVGVAEDEAGLLSGAADLNPQAVVTDIRMPPTFTDEGIRAARELRRLQPGLGVVILSQYDEPQHAIALLAEGAAGYAYLLKDRVAEGDQLARAIREVTAGGTMLDPRIVSALTEPVSEAGLSAEDERLLRLIAEGKPVKAIAAALETTPAAVDAAIDKLFLRLAQDASAGVRGALTHLKMLHLAIVEREEQGDTLSRLLPGGIAERVRREGGRLRETERLSVTVVMSDVRGYSGIAERSDPAELARQVNDHRAAMNRAILGEDGTVMQFVGDAVMAVFGAPVPQSDHAERALRSALAMHAEQTALNARWRAQGLPDFHLGIALSSGEVAAALLGSDERLEYTLVGDSVNLAQRLQQWADGGQVVLSDPTYQLLDTPPDAERIEPQPVKGRSGLVGGYRLDTALMGAASQSPTNM